MAKTTKPALSPEEKTAAANLRKANLAAANKKRAEEKAARKAAEAPEVEETPANQIPEISADFEAILPDIKAGKEVTLEGEKGVYFKFEDNRLRKYSNNGGYIDAYPLYAFQDRKGWRLKK